MKSFLILLLTIFLFSVCGVMAAENYYVDPDYPGSNSDGSAQKPWIRLDQTTQWNVINNALNSSNVTVYFSAREANKDACQSSTNQISILRTDNSTNRITLDGMSKYNANDTNPSWMDYTGSSRLQITGKYPITTKNYGSPTRREIGRAHV